MGGNSGHHDNLEHVGGYILSGHTDVRSRIGGGGGTNSTVNLNLSGAATFSWDDQASFGTDNGTVNLTVTDNASLSNIGGSASNLGAGVGATANLTVSGNGSFTTTTAGFDMTRNVNGASARVTIIGDGVTFDVAGGGDLNYGYRGAQNTWEFQLTETGTVSTVDFGGNLSHDNNNLEVFFDPKGAAARDSYLDSPLVLFNYGTRSAGAFNISVSGLTYTGINYAYNGNSIALEGVYLIPEPASFILFALAGLTMLLRGRRRK
jgi:hypothetical protein